MPNLLILATAAFVAGIWCSRLIRVETAILAVAAAVLVGAALWQIRSGSRYLAVAILGLFVVAGVLRFQQAEAVSGADVSRFAGQTAVLYGTVAELPQWWEIDEETVKVRYIIAAEEVRTSGPQRQPAAGAVLVNLTQPRELSRAAYGDRVVVSGKILDLHGYQNPGQMDVVRSLKLQGITARMAVSSQAFAFGSASLRSWQAKLAEGRQNVTRLIAQAMAPEDAALLTGLLFGGYYGIRQEVVHDFAATGLIHILSVSGTHIALVAGVATWLGGWLGLRRSWSAGLAAVSIVFYALFAGLSPPVVRSVVMGLIVLAAMILGREKDSPQALAVAALGMLAWQPGLIYDISFQLSFGAAAGLVLLYEKTARRLGFLPPFVAKAVAVTASAQLGVLPFLAWYFNSFPLSSFLANVVIVPPIEAVVVLGLAGSLAGTLLPLLGKVLLMAAALLLGIVVKITALLAALPASSLYLPAVGTVGGTVYYLGLAWGYGYLPPAFPSPAGLWRHQPYRTGAALAVMIAAGFLYLYYPRPVQVHFIDVGQGDATLIVTPHGRAVLIDSGGSGEASDFDVGERVVVPYLKHYGVRVLDYLVLTHGHRDHAGGAAGVAASIPVRSVMVAREGFTPAVQALVRTTGGRGIIPAFAGQSITMDDVTFTITHAVGDIRSSSSNEASSVVRVAYGAHSFLITGDLEAQGEQAMLVRGCEPVTVLKVGHHGSRTSSTGEFLRALAPEYAVISVGESNHFGHPHPDTLRRLTELNAKIYRTDRDGAMVFATDGTVLCVTAFAKGNVQ